MSYRSLEAVDFGTVDDMGLFLSKELNTEGSTLEECLDNAWYALIDQDGGEYGQLEADDGEAEEYITKWWNEKTSGAV